MSVIKVLAVLRPCLECGTLAKGGRCPRHAAAANRARLSSPQQREIRNSTAWRKLSMRTRQGAVCADCGVGERLQVHHLDPRAVAGELLASPDGLVVLCVKCHATREAAARRALLDSGGVAADRVAAGGSRAAPGLLANSADRALSSQANASAAKLRKPFVA